MEIPVGSCHKIEWDRKMAAFKLDRVEPQIYAKPVNYGFIPQTLDEDGDELDVLLLTDHPLTTGIFLEARILGVMMVPLSLPVVSLIVQRLPFRGSVRILEPCG